MLSCPEMPPSPDTPHGLVRDLPLAVLWHGGTAVCLQKLTRLSGNINAASWKTFQVVRFAYQANQDCFFGSVSEARTHTNAQIHTQPCSDFLSVQSGSVSLAEEHTLGCTVPPCACALQT